MDNTFVSPTSCFIMKTHSRQLWLLRHAKAEPYQVNDYQRALAKKGIKQIDIVTQAIKNLQPPDLIISSPALRARETTELFCKQLGLDFDLVHWDQRIYEAPTSQLVTVLQEISPANIVLMTGHNPGLEGLYEYLITGLTRAASDSFNHYTIPTATLVQIDMPDNWKTLDPGCAKLRKIIYAKKHHSNN